MNAERLQATSGTSLAGPLLITPRVFGDDRGFFFESWNQRRFDQAVGAATSFCQDNHSQSSRGVLRGLHLQLEPERQGKLVRCTRGQFGMWRWTCGAALPPLPMGSSR
jgi:dTDP-4-dehydrorhamnose 3,5-epimerase